jgi:hypothetical protein
MYGSQYLFFHAFPQFPSILPNLLCKKYTLCMLPLNKHTVIVPNLFIYLLTIDKIKEARSKPFMMAPGKYKRSGSDRPNAARR